MSTPSIWNLNNDIVRFYQQIQEAEGELTEDLEKQLTKLRSNITLFTKDTHQLIRSLESDVSTIDSEIDRLENIKANRTKLIAKIEVDVLALVLSEGTVDEKSKAKVKPSVIEFELGKAVASHSGITLVDEEVCSPTSYNASISDLNEFELYYIKKVIEKLKRTQFLKEEKVFSKSELKKRLELGEEIKGAEIVYRPKLNWK